MQTFYIPFLDLVEYSQKYTFDSIFASANIKLEVNVIVK